MSPSPVSWADPQKSQTGGRIAALWGLEQAAFIAWRFSPLRPQHQFYFPQAWWLSFINEKTKPWSIVWGVGGGDIPPTPQVSIMGFPNLFHPRKLESVLWLMNLGETGRHSSAPSPTSPGSRLPWEDTLSTLPFGELGAGCFKLPISG